MPLSSANITYQEVDMLKPITIKIKNTFLLSLSLLLFSPLVFADETQSCDNIDLTYALNEVTEILDDDDDDSEDFFRSRCKVWPADESKTIAVIASPSKSVDADINEYDNEALYDLLVFILDSKTHRVLAQHHNLKAIISDAIIFTDLSIDTARYQLTPTQRAFGVRIHHSNHSRANPYYRITLTLYIPEAQQLRTVLNDLNVTREGGEWDTTCTGEFTYVGRTITIKPQTHNSFADLQVRTSTRHQTDRWEDATEDNEGVCTSNESVAEYTNSTLQYDGRKYNVPEALSGY